MFQIAEWISNLLVLGLSLVLIAGALLFIWAVGSDIVKHIKE
jgi:hypothetical protein